MNLYGQSLETGPVFVWETLRDDEFQFDPNVRTVLISEANNLLVFVSLREIFALEATTDQKSWQKSFSLSRNESLFELKGQLEAARRDDFLCPAVIRDYRLYAIVSGEMIGSKLIGEVLVCLDITRSGRMLWASPLDRVSTLSKPSVQSDLFCTSAGLCFVVSNQSRTDHEVIRVNFSGENVWSMPLDPSYRAVAMHRESEKVLLVLTDHFVEVDLQSGQLRAPQRHHMRLESAVTRAEFFNQNELLLTTGTALCLWDLKASRKLWCHTFRQPGQQVVFNDSTIVTYGHTFGSGLSCLDPASGEQRWQRRSHHPGEQGLAAPVLNGEAIFWPTQSAMFMVQAHDGTITSRKAFPRVRKNEENLFQVSQSMISLSSTSVSLMTLSP